MAGMEAICRDVDLPALVVEALDKVASPKSRRAVIDEALERAGSDQLPVEVHRMLMFVTGPLLEVTSEVLGPEAASGVVQDLRPVLERAFEQVLERAGVAETIPPERPQSGFVEPARKSNPTLRPPSAPRMDASPPSATGPRQSTPSWPWSEGPVPSHGPGASDAPAASAPPRRRTPKRGTVPYMKAVADRGDVLVVDDDPEFRRGMTRLLEQRGFEVIAAADGPSALKLCQRIWPVLVITDWQMPDMDGAELASLIVESCGNEAPPVILLTGVPDAPATVPGVQQVLQKDGSVERLLEVAESMWAG